MRPHRPDRSGSNIALGYRAVIAAVLLAAALLAAGAVHADSILGVEEAPPLSRLVKFDDRSYEIAYSAAISLEPLSAATVRKIGYGVARDVAIVTTASGVYSNDALVSPYVLYPGITVTEAHEDGERGPGFAILSVGRVPGGGYALNSVTDLGVRSCTAQGSFLTCYRTY